MAIATYKKIASVTVGSGGQASVEFTNIPNTYNDLVLKISGRSTTSEGNMTFTINGSTSSFSWRRLIGDGANASSQSGSDNYASLINLSTYTASTFGNWELYLPNYTGNTNKSISIDAVTENNATTAISVLSAHLWSNTSVVNSIRLTASTSFAQHSTAVLYGIVRSN